MGIYHPVHAKKKKKGNRIKNNETFSIKILASFSPNNNKNIDAISWNPYYIHIFFVLVSHVKILTCFVIIII